jgi:hypothetical protein
MFQPRVAAVLLIILISVSGIVSQAESEVRRGDEIWTCVLFATNEHPPNAPPRWLAPFSGRLRKIFGYNQFMVIGRHVETMAISDGQWFIPTRQFFLEVETRQSRSGAYDLHFTLWHERKMILKTEARVMPGSPLFVRGPQYGRGQLIFVVAVR